MALIFMGGLAQISFLETTADFVLQGYVLYFTVELVEFLFHYEIAELYNEYVISSGMASLGFLMRISTSSIKSFFFYCFRLDLGVEMSGYLIICELLVLL
jgi:hypothetical protein